LKKIWKHRGEKERDLEIKGKNLELEIFVEIYYFEILVVGRARLLVSPEYLGGWILIQRLAKPKNLEFESPSQLFFLKFIIPKKYQ